MYNFTVKYQLFINALLRLFSNDYSITFGINNQLYMCYWTKMFFIIVTSNYDERFSMNEIFSLLFRREREIEL